MNTCDQCGAVFDDEPMTHITKYHPEVGHKDAMIAFEEQHITAIPERKATMANHAEAWHRSKGHSIPIRGTQEWQRMYEEWATWAFSGIGQ